MNRIFFLLLFLTNICLFKLLIFCLLRCDEQSICITIIQFQFLHIRFKKSSNFKSHSVHLNFDYLYWVLLIEKVNNIFKVEDQFLIKILIKKCKNRIPRHYWYVPQILVHLSLFENCSLLAMTKNDASLAGWTLILILIWFRLKIDLQRWHIVPPGFVTKQTIPVSYLLLCFILKLKGETKPAVTRSLVYYLIWIYLYEKNWK